MYFIVDCSNPDMYTVCTNQEGYTLFYNSSDYALLYAANNLQMGMYIVCDAAIAHNYGDK